MADDITRIRSLLSRLRRFIRYFTNKTKGDIISAHVGENARGVAVGKNIIQIGTVKIPIWLMVFIASTVILGVVILIYDTVRTGGRLEEASGQLDKIGIKVLATSTPFPTPTLMPTPTPIRMSDGQFNVAVAEFNAIDLQGQPVDNLDAKELSQSIAKFLSSQEDALTEIVGERVLIWGPDKGIVPIEPDQEEIRTRALNADVLVYGRLAAASNDRWRIEPKFYLTDKAVQQADELRGEYALGNTVMYQTDNTASKGDVNKILRIRLEALVQMLYGLSYMAQNTLQGYQDAAATFQATVDTSEWAKRKDDTGQEILYLFLGNAYLGQSYLTDDASVAQREELLVKSRAAFATAIALDENYARSYNGLGAVLFQIARPLITEDECIWDWAVLSEAVLAYETAIRLPPEAKPPSGQVEFRASLGLGRINFYQGLCLTPEQWASAKQYYEYVISEYEKMTAPIPLIIDIAAYAHTDLATMALLQADYLQGLGDPKFAAEGAEKLKYAIEHYRLVLELTRLSRTEEGTKHAKETIPFYLTALCLDNQQEQVRAVLDEFLNQVTDPEQTRSYIVSLIEPALWKECDNDAQTE